jgi:hypothetical protein
LWVAVVALGGAFVEVVLAVFVKIDNIVRVARLQRLRDAADADGGYFPSAVGNYFIECLLVVLLAGSADEGQGER